MRGLTVKKKITAPVVPAFCKGVPPWAPFLVRFRGAHGGTPLQCSRASVEIPFQRSFSPHVQSHAMRATTKQLGVPQLKRNHIQTLPLQELY